MVYSILFVNISNSYGCAEQKAKTYVELNSGLSPDFGFPLNVSLCERLSERLSQQESLANAKENVRQHCVSLSCLCNSLTQIEWVANLSQHLGSKVTHVRVNDMPIMDYVLEYNNFSLGKKIRKI